MEKDVFISPVQLESMGCPHLPDTCARLFITARYYTYSWRRSVVAGKIRN